MAEMTVWGRHSAFNVQKVLWLLDELDVSFESVKVGGAHGGLDAPDFLAMNPHGRIPVLRDEQVTLWESHSILRYLAATYGAAEFWPPTPGMRSGAERWMDWAQTTFQPDFMRLFWGFYRTPPAERNGSQIETAKQACETHFRLLDRELATRPYLAGESFGLGDIPAAAALHRYFGMGLDVEQPRHVMKWFSRLSERPAFARRIEVPFDDLAGRQGF